MDENVEPIDREEMPFGHKVAMIIVGLIVSGIAGALAEEAYKKFIVNRNTETPPELTQ